MNVYINGVLVENIIYHLENLKQYVTYPYEIEALNAAIAAVKIAAPYQYAIHNMRQNLHKNLNSIVKTEERRVKDDTLRHG